QGTLAEGGFRICPGAGSRTPRARKDGRWPAETASTWGARLLSRPDPRSVEFMTATGSASEAAAGPRPKRKISTKQIASFVFGMVIVVGIFVFAIPRFADYGEVWAAVKTLTPLEFWSLFAAMVFNLFTYWIANMAAL